MYIKISQLGGTRKSSVSKSAMEHFEVRKANSSKKRHNNMLKNSKRQFRPKQLTIAKDAY